ncbi:MAG TPA: ABC-type transport auxiliary lipoprotein family protein [Caulobacteraceae bacterium]
MIPIASFGRGLFVVILAGLTSACISLFPKETPAQLYRFGAAPPAAAPAPAGPRFAVLDPSVAFDREAAGDAILTVTGDQAAYIKGARWVSSASTLFESALENAFFADGGPARLMARGEVGHADYALHLDVREFDARYDHGSDAAPEIVVRVHAGLTRLEGRSLAGERIFEARIAASDNRAGAIAQAFDQAVGKVLGELVAWVDAGGAG